MALASITGPPPRSRRPARRRSFARHCPSMGDEREHRACTTSGQPRAFRACGRGDDDPDGTDGHGRARCLLRGGRRRPGAGCAGGGASRSSSGRAAGGIRAPASLVTSDGFLLTNSHVGQRDDRSAPAFPTALPGAAYLVGDDPDTDLALSQVHQSSGGPARAAPRTGCGRPDRDRGRQPAGLRLRSRPASSARSAVAARAVGAAHRRRAADRRRAEPGQFRRAAAGQQRPRHRRQHRDDHGGAGPVLRGREQHGALRPGRICATAVCGGLSGLPGRPSDRAGPRPHRSARGIDGGQRDGGDGRTAPRAGWPAPRRPVAVDEPSSPAWTACTGC